MNSFNIWLGMSPEFRAAVTPPEEGGEADVGTFTALNTLAPETKDMLLGTYDVPAQEALFAANGIYRLYSHYGQPAGATLVKADVDMLIATYPSDLAVLGAWEANGREAGATYSEEIIADPEADPPIVGVPSEQTAPGWYPVPATVLNYMPDIVTDPGDPDALPTPIPPTYAPATEPTDVNTLFGQALRDFSSFYP